MNQEYQNAKQSVMNLQSWEDYQLEPKPTKSRKTVHDLINDKGYVIRKKDQIRRQSQAASCFYVPNYQKINCISNIKQLEFHDHMTLDQIKKKEQDIYRVKQNYQKDRLYKIQKYYEVSNNSVFMKLDQLKSLTFNKMMKHQQQFNIILKENQVMNDKQKHLKQLIKYLEQCIDQEKNKKKQGVPKQNSQNALHMGSQQRRASLISQSKKNSGDDTKVRTQSQLSSSQKEEMMMIKFVQNIRGKSQVLAQYQQDLSQFKNNINTNKKTISMINDQIDKCKTQLDNVKEYKMGFEKKILLNGNDNRSQGLSWIIQQLTQQGQNVEQSELPVFLDEKAKQYLMQKARLEQEIDVNILLQQTILDIYKVYVNGYKSQVMNQEDVKCDSKSFDEYFSSVNQIYKSSKKQQQDGDEDSQKLSQRSLKDSYRQQLQNILYKDVLYDKKMKQTLNSLVYDQAKQRIKQIMGSNKEYKQINDVKSIELEDEDVEENKEEESRMNIFIKNNGCEVLDQQSHILIYQEDKLINDYKYKSDFITDYQNFTHKIDSLKKQLNQIMVEEQNRISREIIFKDYLTKWNVTMQQLLCCLFGYQMSTKMILSLAQKIYSKTPHS